MTLLTAAGSLAIKATLAVTTYEVMPTRKLEKYLTRQFELRVQKDNVEREQKYRVGKIDSIRSNLFRLGAEVQARGYERNELFDFDERLRRQGRKLRLRRHGNHLAMLTLKGPRLKGHHKTRMEVQTPVDYEAAKQILELVGFRINETYSKMREEYRLDGCAVCLDHIPNAGWFVEIEGARGKISKVARRLGLLRHHREARSYRKLIREASANGQQKTNGSNGHSRA
jgi:adenylate cyclase class 2